VKLSSHNQVLACLGGGSQQKYKQSHATFVSVVQSLTRSIGMIRQVDYARPPPESHGIKLHVGRSDVSMLALLLVHVVKYFDRTRRFEQMAKPLILLKQETR